MDNADDAVGLGTEGDAETGQDDGQKDPAEQEALARDLGDELTDVFARFVRGEVDYADLTFLTFETLQDLYVIASGAYELEYDEEDDPEDQEHDTPTEQQEELAQEPAGP
ncbi:MAG: hypothetical protein M3Q10_15600 [Chloroflexota bacterium]|nr:hypothetical protein [Chloroflexota bacterium]